MSDVVKNGSIIYLHSEGVWYQYDERNPPLGSGAMGTVYLGRERNGGMRVAIKRVVDKYSNMPNIRQRAKMEASLMFRHPHLVEMMGYCEVMPNRGPIFIISKLVQGVNIDVFVRQAFSKASSDRQKRLCHLFFPILDALEYLHAHNICHLDIKPSNIMVENGSNVRLMDLGIAQMETALDSGGTMGTPQYAAPEQFSGSTNGSRDLKPYTDVYQAGVTLYELLTGTNPYKSQNLQDCIKKHKDIVLPKSPNITTPLLKVLRRATSHYYSERYATAGQFKAALEEALEKKSFWPW